jgi:hypothetical protein
MFGKSKIMQIANRLYKNLYSVSIFVLLASAYALVASFTHHFGYGVENER